MLDLLINLAATRSAMLLNPSEENKLAYRCCLSAWMRTQTQEARYE